MNELDRNELAAQIELAGIIDKLESALADLDRLQLLAIGAHLSQVIDDVRCLLGV